MLPLEVLTKHLQSLYYNPEAKVFRFIAEVDGVLMCSPTFVEDDVRLNTSAFHAAVRVIDRSVILPSVI